MTEKEEFVEVTLKLPRAAYDFWKALTTFLKRDMETYLVSMITDDIPTLIDDFSAVIGPIIKEEYGFGETEQHE